MLHVLDSKHSPGLIVLSTDDAEQAADVAERYSAANGRKCVIADDGEAPLPDASADARASERARTRR